MKGGECVGNLPFTQRMSWRNLAKHLHLSKKQ